MDNPSRLWGQIAAEGGCSANRAKMAAYLMNLAKDGRSLEAACAAVRRKPATLKTLSREFMIDWPDYKPFAAALAKGEERPAARVKLSL